MFDCLIISCSVILVYTKTLVSGWSYSGSAWYEIRNHLKSLGAALKNKQKNYKGTIVLDILHDDVIGAPTILQQIYFAYWTSQILYCFGGKKPAFCKAEQIICWIPFLMLDFYL